MPHACTTLTVGCTVSNAYSLRGNDGYYGYAEAQSLSTEHRHWSLSTNVHWICVLPIASGFSSHFSSHFNVPLQMQTPEPVQQPRRQAAERTHKPFGDDGKAQPPDAARTAAGPRAALALGLGSVAPAPGLLLPADAAPAAGAAAAGPGPGGSRAPLQATSSSPGAAGPATGASVAVGAVTGVEAAGAEGGAADAGASGKQRRAGGKKKKKKKKRNRQKTAEQMPDIAPTLFGADPQLKIGRGQAAGTSA